MHGLETINRQNRPADLRLGLRAMISDDANGRWFSGEVISVSDDPAGNVTVKLRPDTLRAPGRLPIHPQHGAIDYQRLLFLWLLAHSLLSLLRLVLE